MKAINALLLGAVLWATLTPSLDNALASTASPAPKIENKAVSEPAPKVEALPPQVEAPAPAPEMVVTEQVAEDVLEQAPVIPELPLFGKIIAWVVAVNLLLGGLAAALAKVKDITSTKVDDEMYAAISKVAGFLAKILDLATANTRPKNK